MPHPKYIGTVNPPEVQTQPDSGEIAPAKLRNHLVSPVQCLTYLYRVVPT